MRTEGTKMRIMVTGSEGYVGSKLCRKLEEYGHELVRVDIRLGTDLLNENTRLDRDCNRVIHLASRVSNRSTDASTIYDNVRMTNKVLEYYMAEDVVFASSASVYDSSIMPVREYDTLNPKTPYAVSKVACERILEGAIILRLFNIYGGEGGRGILSLLRSGAPVTINGDGEQIRDYIHVDDIVNSFIYAATKEGLSCGFTSYPDVYNIGSGRGTSINQLIEMLGAKDRVTYYPDVTNVGIRYSIADNSRMRYAGFPEPRLLEECI